MGVRWARWTLPALVVDELADGQSIATRAAFIFRS
jgi:hypothetical protein